ncbi:PREDICTED: uncharacterized protein LOC104767842 [Camelina sativa]|uniref:Uncharacterized protein LOC104767842 n=1 Tax=Camelina sativa TaxID=90675 RepID=A0ABM0XS07_CAMSA|nr:PREDICTED: uncharacterized protein LOC104767842 [Camelina sativa]
MANSEWIMEFSSGRSEYLRFEGSDHRLLVTSFEPFRKKRRGLFCYDRALKGNEEVRKLVLEAWNSILDASVEKRLDACRRAIITWSKYHHEISQKEIISLRKALEENMTKDEENQAELERINRELLKAYQNEETFWKQRSRQLWLTLGDKNIGYFHAATKSWRALNNISVMESATGNPVYEEKEIVTAITDYFHQIFTSQEGNRMDCGPGGPSSLHLTGHE